MVDPRRAIPSTGDLLGDPTLVAACQRLTRESVVHAIREAQAEARAGRIAAAQVRDEAVRRLPRGPTRLRRVINATGVVVHTNLGRAALSDAAVQALAVAAGTTDVELDLETGRRSRRGRAALAALAAAVPESDDVHVVNNGAAALALSAAALAQDRTVVVARGELVEIGDGFRIPELLEAAGAHLREVGTTNRVRLDDYAEALDDHTGFILKVHPSNFVVRGFTASVSVNELSRLPARVVADIGSGLLRPHERLPHEPDATNTLRAGAALVTASGDKLLGGPQCGLMLGRADLIDVIRRHPLARAYRVDKLTLAALEATLTGPGTPVGRALEVEQAELRRRADLMAKELGDVVAAHSADTAAAVGGGGAPDADLPSAAVILPQALAQPLRLSDPAVLGRVRHGKLQLDLIAVDPRDDELLVELIRRTAGQLEAGD